MISNFRVFLHKLVNDLTPFLQLLQWRIESVFYKKTISSITYANDVKTDGAGAQLQRIYGIYAISRLLSIPYVHSPLIKIDYQGLNALEQNSGSDEILLRWNKEHTLPSDADYSPAETLKRTVVSPNLKELISLRREAYSRRQSIQLRIAIPYKVTDILPNSYKVIRNLNYLKQEIHNRSELRIAIHVRRGELFVVDSHRMLPNQYYLTVAEQIARTFDKFRLKYSFELFTEVPKRRFTVTPSHHGIIGRISDPILVNPEDCQINDFKVLPNLKKYINTDPVEAVKLMSSADILVLSRSSFSYLAAIINSSGVIIYNPFWHAALSDWIVVNDAGTLSESKLKRQLKIKQVIH